jgi:hypothetical protein
MGHWALAKHRHVSCQFHDRYIVVAADNTHNNISSFCVRFYKDCVKKDLGVDNSHRNSTYIFCIPIQRLRKRNYWKSISMLCVPFEFQQRWRTWLPSSTGYLNCTNVHSNSATLLSLPTSPQNLFINYLHIFYQLTNQCFRITVTKHLSILNSKTG